MRGARIAGLLIRQARLRRDWSQDGLCLGICTPSYLSKIEQGKAEPSPEVTELLLRRLGLVWIPEPEDLKPCWNALLSGSPGFFLCYEQLVLPQQERLACSPLAADILLLAAFTQIPCSPCRRNGSRFSPPGSWLCSVLCRGGGTRPHGWNRCRCCPRSTGKPSTQRGEYTTAIEVLRDAYRSAADAGYPHMMLSCRILIGNCYSDLGRMEEMMTHFSVAEHLAEALGDTDSLASLRYNTAATQLQLGQPEKALSYFSSLPHPSFLDLHKLAICHEQLGHREQALAAVQQAGLWPPARQSGRCWRWYAIGWACGLPSRQRLRRAAAGLLPAAAGDIPMGFTRFHLQWVLAWYKANRQYRQACRLLEEFPVIWFLAI